MEDAIYGGRVDNTFDMRVLRSYLKVFFTDEIASDNGGGLDIIQGSSLIMPKNADYQSFLSIIGRVRTRFQFTPLSC
jgi:Dynein heavy chain AAA lid domain